MANQRGLSLSLRVGALVLVVLLGGLLCIFALPIGRYVLGNLLSLAGPGQAAALGRPGDELVVMLAQTNEQEWSHQAVALRDQAGQTLTFLAAPGKSLSIKPGEALQQSGDGRYLRAGDQALAPWTGEAIQRASAMDWQALPAASASVDGDPALDNAIRYSISLSNGGFPLLFGDWELSIFNRADQTTRPVYRGRGRPLQSGWMPDQNTVAIQTDRGLVMVRVR